MSLERRRFADSMQQAGRQRSASQCLVQHSTQLGLLALLGQLHPPMGPVEMS